MTTTPDLKGLLHQCLDPKTDDDSIKEALVTLTKEEYRESIFQELYVIYLKTKSFDWEVGSFLFRYFSFNKNNEVLNPCFEILEKMGDEYFTVAVLNSIYIDPKNSLIPWIIDKYLPLMIENDSVIKEVLKHEYLKEEKIEILIKSLEHSVGKSIPSLYSIFDNPNITPQQIDRVAFLLKDSPGFSTWLYLAINPKLDITMINNHLRLKGFNNFLERSQASCKKIIVENNQNKSNIHKMILLECLPCLSEWGLEVNPLDMAIEVLEDVL